MWIKTPDGKIINLEKINTVEFDDYCKGNLAFRLEGTFHRVRFENNEQAQKYLDKLAEKLGAEEIKIDET